MQSLWRRASASRGGATIGAEAEASTRADDWPEKRRSARESRRARCAEAAAADDDDDNRREIEFAARPTQRQQLGEQLEQRLS